MGAEDAVKALQGLPKQFHTGINFDELKKFDRWEIIKYVRNIATAAVKDDVELSPDLAKFARHGRSTQQVAAGLKRKAEEVFKKQIDLLDGLDIDCKLTDAGTQESGGSKVSRSVWSPAVLVEHQHLVRGSQITLYFVRDHNLYILCFQ